MARIAAWLLLVCTLQCATATSSLGAEWPQDSFVVLCYHDIRDNARQHPDAYTLETGQLVLQFEWLRAEGYHVVSFDEVLAARGGGRPLPPRAVLITFDDGLESAYSRAFPLLRAFHYPAVVALVGSWMERGDEASATRSDFLSQSDIDTMRASGLIEFASHSYALHEGVLANPQGNLEPAAVTRRYDALAGSVEERAARETRIEADLARNSEQIAAFTGVRPRLIAWPYGAHDRLTDGIAARLGMPYGMSLELGLNTPDVPLTRMRRVLVTHDYTTADLARVLEGPLPRAPLRAVMVSLDRLQDPDPVRQEARLSRLLDRIEALGVNAAFVQATPAQLRPPLLNRVAWQLRTRTGVAVYAGLAPGVSGDAAELMDLHDQLSAAAPFQGLLLSAPPGAVAAGVAADHDGLVTVQVVTAEAGSGAPADTQPVADFVLIPAAARTPHDDLARTVFLLSPGVNLAQRIDRLRAAGGRNFAVPDEALDLPPPAFDALRRALSLRTFPRDN